MLQAIDRGRLFDELLALRFAAESWPAGEVRLHVKRLRAILPDDPDLVDLPPEHAAEVARLCGLLGDVTEYLSLEPDEALVSLAGPDVWKLAGLIRTFAPDAESTSEAPDPQGNKPHKASVNALVLDLLQRRPEAHGWSVRKIAAEICRGKTAVAGCSAYKELDTAREMARLERERKAQEANERRGRNRTK